MRKLIIPFATLALPLSACATSPYGSGYGADPITSAIAVLGGAVGSGHAGYGHNSGYGYSFTQAAVHACGSTASRYGQVGIRDVRQVSGSTVRVYGVVSNGYRSRSWDCDFRSDGRITDFDF